MQLYVVGMGKTGTTSLAAAFGAYRSGHEVDATRMKRLAARARAGDLEPSRARWELRRRDLRFRLEVDSAHFLTPFVPQLADLYPRAHFVVLIRDCFSWVDSLLEHWSRLATRITDTHGHRFESADLDEVPNVVKTWASVEGQLLRGQSNAGLAVALLRAWATTYTRLLDEVPEERTLILRTDDIDTAAQRLAALCRVDAGTLRLDERRNVGPHRAGVLDGVPVAVALREAERWCAPLMEQFWGTDWRATATRVPAWSAPSPKLT